MTQVVRHVLSLHKSIGVGIPRDASPDAQMKLLISNRLSKHATITRSRAACVETTLTTWRFGMDWADMT